jgi:calcineurin-like phosphoesterase
VLPGGTAYVTDVGMVGPRDGVIGVAKEAVIKRFLTGIPHRFEVAEGPVTFNSVAISIDRLTGRAISISRNDLIHT